MGNVRVSGVHANGLWPENSRQIDCGLFSKLETILWGRMAYISVLGAVVSGEDADSHTHSEDPQHSELQKGQSLSGRDCRRAHQVIIPFHPCFTLSLPWHTYLATVIALHV